MNGNSVLSLVLRIVSIAAILIVISIQPTLAEYEDPPDTFPQHDIQSTLENPAVDDGLANIYAAYEQVREQGPEAVLAFAETLHGPARDALQDEIDAAWEAWLAMNPRVVTPPEGEITFEDEALMNQLELESAAASRQRAFSQHDDPEELLIMAQEAEALPLIESPDSADFSYRFVGSTCTYSTIAAAIAASNPGDIIYLEGGVTFAGGFTIDKNLTIYGGYSGCGSGSSAATTITGYNLYRVMTIAQGLTVHLHNMSLTSGNASASSGGGISFAAGTSGGLLTLDNVHISNCDASYGAGLWAGPNSQINGTNVLIHDNDAVQYGGGVRMMGATATFTGTAIYNNTAPLGGGVYGSRSGYANLHLDLASSADVYLNEALSAGDALGGGIYFTEGLIELAHASDIYSNKADYGGGMYVLTTTVTFAGSDVELQSNSANVSGGGLWAFNSEISVNNSAEVLNNTADHRGGGVYLDKSDLYANQGSIKGNTATTSNGGGAYLVNGSLLDMNASSYGCTGARCTQLSNNTSAQKGGGLYATGSTVNLHELWIEDNEAYYGGGIYVSSSTLYLYNALIARNYNTYTGTSGPAADGVRLYIATMLGSQNTFAYNDNGGAATGGAIGSTGSTMTLSNSIIWGHSTSINDTTHTVTCSDVQGGYTGSGNRNQDPLFVNSGAHDYHLQASSPVLDRCSSGQAIDFDLDARPVRSVRPSTPFDMGADEYGVNRVGINGGGCLYGNIQVAVDTASAGNTIKVAVGTFTENVDVTKNLTIRGGYNPADCTTSVITATTTVDGNASASVFDVDGSSVTLRNMVLTNGAGLGAGLMANGNADVTLQDTAIYDNHGSTGGGVFIGSGSVVTLTGDSDISYNTATQVGGGVYVSGRLYGGVDTSDIYENSALHGGGIYALEGDVDLWSSDVYQNNAISATGKGGGIYAGEGSTVSLANSTFIYFQNTAYNGAGIYADDSTITMQGAYFRENVASNHGGALYLNNGSVLSGHGYIGQYDVSPHNQAVRGGGIYAVHSTIDISGYVLGNEAHDYGAGIYANNSTVNLTDFDIGSPGSANDNYLTDAAGYGAGMFLSASQATLNDTDVHYNRITGSPLVAQGVGLMLQSGSVLTMTGGSIANHTAVGSTFGNGAGLFMYGSQATLDNVDVMTNTSSHDGGAMWIIQGSVLTMTNSLVQNNESTGGYGGAISVHNTGSRLVLNNSEFYDNESTYGGAIYASSDTELDCNNSSFGDFGLGNRASSGPGAGGAIVVDGADFGAFNCTFTDNRAINHGGAVAVYSAEADFNYNKGSCDPATTRCSAFAYNTADSDGNNIGYGGGIYADNSTLTVNHTWMYNNAAVEGGAIYLNASSSTAYLKNSLLYDNTSTSSFGAGIRNQGGVFTIQQSTLAENQNGAGYSQNGSTASSTIKWSIAWGNSNGGFWYTGGTMSGNCNTDQSHNVGAVADPSFVDAGCNDFRLNYDSPAIDVCTNGLGNDLDGNSRPVGAKYDRGAFEFHDFDVFLPISLKQ